MKKAAGILFFLAALALAPRTASAHCDAEDGPVAKATQKALATGKIGYVLAWVQKGDEQVIRDAFKDTLAVRKQSPQARKLADRWFLETLVRVHRAGEGAPFTGIKPAGQDLGPAIPAADRALEDGKLQPVGKLVMGAAEQGLHARFEEARARRNFNPDDPEAGRAYVRAYVEYLHYVEGLYKAATKGGDEHAAQPTATAHED